MLESRTREADLARQQAEARAIEVERRMAEAEAARRAAEEARARADRLEQELADVGAQRTDRGQVLTLGDVLFDLNRAELKPGALRNLYKLVTFLV